MERRQERKWKGGAGRGRSNKGRWGAVGRDQDVKVGKTWLEGEEEREGGREQHVRM